MIIGIRRLVVLSEILLTIIILGTMVYSSNCEKDMAYFTTAVSVIGAIGAVYFGADGYVKSKLNKDDIKNN